MSRCPKIHNNKAALQREAGVETSMVVDAQDNRKRKASDSGSQRPSKQQSQGSSSGQAIDLSNTKRAMREVLDEKLAARDDLHVDEDAAERDMQRLMAGRNTGNQRTPLPSDSDSDR